MNLYDMKDDISFLMEMADYCAEDDPNLTNLCIASVVLRGGMVGMVPTRSFTGETVPTCYVKLGDRGLQYIGRKDDEPHKLFEGCLRSMTTGPLWEHCDNCSYVGTYPLRDGSGWADVWLACHFSTEHYAVRTGKDDMEATDDAGQFVSAPFISYEETPCNAEDPHKRKGYACVYREGHDTDKFAHRFERTDDDN